MKSQNKEELDITEKKLKQVGIGILIVVILMTVLFFLTKQ